MKEEEEEEGKMTSSAEEENLEIVSIGVLYEQGPPWEKKYWSSSRGKDRYPYPVGYEAIRVHNGTTYNMEIRQGLKGPVFLITCASLALSSSGQTPRIAFLNLLKLSSPPRPRPRPRPNTTIDAVHFFGFRNSLVLRLLRELVSNLNHSPPPPIHTASPTGPTPTNNNDHLFAPDSLDDAISPAPPLHDNNPCDSDKTLCDSVAHSMMSLLLPQAFPLLNNPTKKTKLNPNHPPALPNDDSSIQKKCALIDDPSPVVQSLQRVNSAICDGFNIDSCEKHVNNQKIDVDFSEAHKDTGPPRDHSLLSHNDTQKVSSPSHATVTKKSSKDVANHASYVSDNDRSQRGDIIVPKSAVSLTYRRKKKKSNNSADVGVVLQESSSCREKHSEDTGDANLLDTETIFSSSDKERNSNTEVCKCDNIVCTGWCDASLSTRKYSSSLSQTVMCQIFEDSCASEGYAGTENLLVSENCLLKSSNEKISVTLEASIERNPCSSLADKGVSNEVGACYNVVPMGSQDQALDSEDTNARESHDPPVVLDKELLRQAGLQEFSSSKRFLQERTKTCVTDAGETQAGSEVKPHMMDLDTINGKLGKFVELVGCYEHPMPISSVISCITENEIYVGVACGPLTDRAKTLFVYKIPIIEPRDGCPSFIGHASIMLADVEGAFCRQTMPDRADLQFTPDGQGLVLLNSVKASYCREGTVLCHCSACTSARFEENAIRIVRVKSGYVSLVAKMKTGNRALAMLVCGPNHLVAVEEGGRLHLWVMNSEWSVKTEEFFIPGSDHISPSVEELKQIPKHAHLIIGHNGYGEFILWDIFKRVIISRFSAPSQSNLQFLPICLFGWKKNKLFSSNPSVEEQINNIMAATKISSSDHAENIAFLPFEDREMGIWLLVSTFSDLDPPYNTESNWQVNPVRCWRLALLVENLVILGDALDPRASAIGASAGCGIIATCDGIVYVWELATGTKLGTLHQFKDGGVSCISTDYSRCGVLAVAGDGGHLRIYLQHHRDFPD